METYYERFMKCSCGKIQRQIAINLPLDWIGKSLDKMQREDFIARHKCDNGIIKYTIWKTK